MKNNKLLQVFILILGVLNIGNTQISNDGLLANYSFEANVNDDSENGLDEVIEDAVYTQSCNGLDEVDLNQNLLLHYSLDNNAMDDSGNGFDGVMNMISDADDRFGTEEKAAYFEIGSTIVLPESSILQPDYPFSVSLWSLVEDFDGHVALFNSDYVENNYSGAWVVQTSDGRLSCGIGNNIGFTSATARRSIVTLQKVQTNKWNHIVCLFNGPDDFHIYVDGCEEAVEKSGTGEWTISYSDNPGILGKFDNVTATNEDFFNLKGALDEFYFWGRSITEEEILYLYDQFKVPNILNQHEFTYNGVDPVVIGANPAMIDVTWSTGETGNIAFVSEAGHYMVEGYYGCILVCDTFIIEDMIVEVDCDIIDAQSISCGHNAFNCVLGEENGSLKYYYEGHLRIPESYVLCDDNDLNVDFNIGTIDIIHFSSHVHSDGVEWITYEAYLYIDDEDMFEQGEALITFNLCSEDSGVTSTHCISYSLPYKACYTDYECKVYNEGVSIGKEDFVDINYCFDLHEVIQDACSVTSFNIEAMIYGDYMSKTVLDIDLEGDFNHKRCIKIPVSIEDFLSQDYNCVELFINGDCPGISCAHLDCNVFYTPGKSIGSSDSNSTGIWQINAKKNPNPKGIIKSDIAKSILDMEVYPIPASNSISVSMGSSIEENNYRLELKNMLGQVSLALNLHSETTEIDLSTFNSGIYYISLFENGELLSSKKVIKL